MGDTFARIRYGVRRSMRKSSGQLVVLALIALSIPVGVVLVRSAIQYRTQAVGETVLLYVSPSSQTLPPASTFQIMADAKTNLIGFVRVKFTFDPVKIQLTNEITTSTALSTVVEKTTMAEANATGTVVLVLALAPTDTATPATDIFQVASASFTPVSVTANDSTSIALLTADSQVVDMTSNTIPVSNMDGALTLNPSTPITLTNTIAPSISSAPITPISDLISLTPTPLVSTTNVLEAENMSFSSNAVSVLADAGASSGKVLEYFSNASATGNIITPNNTTQLVVTTRGESCKGNAKIEVSVDGVAVMRNKGVSGSTYTNYTFTLNKTAGQHTISATFTNDFASNTCDRNLLLDKVTLQ